MDSKKVILVLTLRPTLDKGVESNFLGTNLDWFEANWILELDCTLVPSLILGSPKSGVLHLGLFFGLNQLIFHPKKVPCRFSLNLPLFDFGSSCEVTLKPQWGPFPFCFLPSTPTYTFPGQKLRPVCYREHVPCSLLPLWCAICLLRLSIKSLSLKMEKNLKHLTFCYLPMLWKVKVCQGFWRVKVWGVGRVLESAGPQQHAVDQ